ncbi:MAG: hypothetical protein ACYDEQ_03935 [Desulfocucumaceae bacterium]
MLDNEIVPQTTLSITTSSRPIRVAFLINPDLTNNTELNQIIRFNIGVWGGKYNVIIPTTGKDFLPDWWDFLIAIDPDIIYSFVPLEIELINRINRYILPTKIHEIDTDERTRLGERHLISTHEIGALGDI